MGYKVLALKWRPQKFEQVIGQEHITKALNNAIKFDRLSHAFTFSGPRGVGKTTTARILAQQLNDIDDINTSFDIIEMDAASNRGIDEIRSLRENVSLAPAHGKYKIYIIDEVHMLTKEAFNALLKTLEEPPEHTVFILATTDPHKMPATILSRTQRYDFRRLSIGDIKKQLVIILKTEEKKFDEVALELIARKADGSMRDALGYLDQVMNYCTDDIDLNSVQKILGLIGDQVYLSIFNNIYNNNVSEVVKTVNDIVMGGVSIHDFVTGFNVFLRSVLYCKIGNSNVDFIQDWLKKNDEINQLDIIRIMELIVKFELKIKLLDQTDLALELLMIKLCNLDKFSDISDVISSIDINQNKDSKKKDFIKPSNKIDNNQGNNKIVENVSNKIQEPVNESKKSERNKSDNSSNKIKNNIENDNKIKDLSAVANNLNKKKIIDKIDDIVNCIDEKNSKISSLLDDIDVVDVNSQDIIIKVNNISDFIYDTLMNGINIIKDGFNVILKTDHGIIIEKGTKIDVNKNKNIDNKKDEEHPLFMDFLEKFDGEILR
tara:strand:+ start:1040 stop:2680 length:1641 start_codon:yes stop_codon:yes gene_type:complete